MSVKRKIIVSVFQVMFSIGLVYLFEPLIDNVAKRTISQEHFVVNLANFNLLALFDLLLFISCILAFLVNVIVVTDYLDKHLIRKDI